MVSLVTSAVTGLPTVDEQVELAEEIGEMVRLYAEDPFGNLRRLWVESTTPISLMQLPMFAHWQSQNLGALH